MGGASRSVWVYHRIPTTPLASEDPATVYEAGERLRKILLTFGEKLQKPVTHSRALAATGRRIHIVVITWEDRLAPPENMPARQARWLAESFDDQGGYLVPQRAVFLGVEAKIKGTTGLARTVFSGMKELFFGEDLDLSPYQSDIADIRRILGSHRGVPITEADRRQLTAWYSGGRATDMPMAEDVSCIWPDPDSFSARRGIRVGDPIEMAGVVTFGHGDPPVWVHNGERWAEAALDHPKGPCVLSIRGELVHPDIARLRSRDAQRRILSDLEEHDKTLDLPKTELEERAVLAKQVEEYYRVDPEPPFTEVSIICGRRLSPDEEATDTYLDALGSYDIEIRPLEHRQIWALEETLPTSTKRVSPHLQDFNLSAVTHSGIMAFSALGDDEGLYVGLSHPNLTPVWMDPKRASSGHASNQSPVVGIFGDPGSGKAQPLDAKILTPHGWTTMGKIRVGDQIIGVDGKPHNVVGVYPQGQKEIYQVAFSDGSSTECCEEHLWTVSQDDPTDPEPTWQVLPLSDLRHDLVDVNGMAKWRIPELETINQPATDETSGNPLAPDARILSSVEPVGRKEAQCIMTDAPGGLYVTDDFIVTHNTFLLQSLSVQAALAGYRSIFVNPKSDDDLSPMAKMTGGEVITLGDDESESGALDPFRYASPRLAARLAAINLLGLYRAEQGRRNLEADVIARFDRAAVSARCSMDLIKTLSEDHPELYAFASNLVASHPLVALTIATAERKPFAVSKGLTLIQFDRPLALPTLIDPDKWEMEQAVAVSCLRMVLRGCLEILLGSDGRGFFATDEAWALLSWQEGLDFITRLGKEGRSQGITLALATHLIAEVAGRDLVGYLGRIFTGMLKDKVQAAAALSLCGVEATDERMEWLRTECGPEAPNPKKGTPAHPSTFLHRDLDGRHAPVMVAPYAEHIRAQLSTSSTDVHARRSQVTQKGTK